MPLCYTSSCFFYAHVASYYAFRSFCYTLASFLCFWVCLLCFWVAFLHFWVCCTTFVTFLDVLRSSCYTSEKTFITLLSSCYAFVHWFYASGGRKNLGFGLQISSKKLKACDQYSLDPSQIVSYPSHTLFWSIYWVFNSFSCSLHITPYHHFSISMKDKP